MIKYIEIKGDFNDADYITARNKVTDETLKELEPIIEAIKNCKNDYNWGLSEACDDDERPSEVYKDILTKDQIELFNNYIPWGEYRIHSIDSITILHVEKEENVL